MTDLMNLIQNRRSCRKYEPQTIPPEHLQQVLEALRWAPSWANTQCWEVVVVTETSVKEALQAALPPTGNPAVKAMVLAPVVLALCAKTGESGFYKGQATTKFGDWMLYDLGLATQNACLMAHSLGMATVIVGMFDHQKAAAAIHLPQGYELVSLIPMGYPSKISPPPKRKPIDEFIHYEQW
jgi:nitroreductase